MTAVLGVLVVVLAALLATVFVGQRRLARRLRVAAERLSADVVASGTGLAEATSVIERVVDRTLLRGGEGSIVEARLANALAVIPQGVVVFDDTGSIAYRNDVAAGYLTARHGEALVEEAIAELAEQAASRSGSDAPARTVDLFGPPRRTLVLKAIRLQEDARPLGVLLVIDDVTDRRRLEAVRRDFVANISHELKTPVGALALLAETLLAEDEPVVARRLAERMLTEAFRVGRTIDDLLELSRIEADEEARREDVPVQAFIAQAVDRVRPAAEQQEIEIEVDEPAARLAVAGDRRQLVSATYNLLENAVKYSDPGSTIDVRARTDGRWVDIEVQDHGIGIPRRDLERVFERFYRVDRGRSRETGGTGLGLAIVRHVASNHAGDVRVESAEGEGSTFTLRLPVGTGPVAVTAEAG
jgi:two-component system, OmpR family, sensor histidine kinase SenX3